MERTNREYLESLVEGVKYTHKGRATVCSLSVFGFQIEGSSFCNARKDFIRHVGEKVAYENALNNLRQHEDYAALRNNNATARKL